MSAQKTHGYFWEITLLTYEKVTAFHNRTYATSNTAPEFSVTWQYPKGPETAPVHAFPNAQVANGVMPIKLQSLQHINLEMKWTYGVGTEAATSTDVQELTRNLVNTNVAIDMFLDNNKSNSQSSTESKYEVMVWFAVFGTAAEPIGLKQGVIATQVLNGITLLVLNISYLRASANSVF